MVPDTPGAGQSPAALELIGVSKRFDQRRWLFHCVSLRVGRGETVSIQGESGSGKSTLLNLVAGIEPPDEGQILVAGQPVVAADDHHCARLRARHIGFVFQAFHLLPNLPVWRNIALPLLLNGYSLSAARERAEHALAELGLSALSEAAVTRLSGGEQQRVALLRALIHEPQLVLADEPTGNLDPQSAESALNLLSERVRKSGAAMLMVTHSRQAASACSRHIQLTCAGFAEELQA